MTLQPSTRPTTVLVHPRAHVRPRSPSAHAAPPRWAWVVARWLAWCNGRVDLAPSTLTVYRRVAQHLTAWGGDERVGILDLAPYARLRRDAGIAQRTMAMELRVATIAFRWADGRDLLPPTARLRVPRIKIDPARFVVNHRTPTPEEAGDALAAMPDDDWRLVGLVLARTGARVGEVVHLRGRDLDEPGCQVAFGATSHSSKTGTRWFPLDDATLVALAGRSDRGAAPLFDLGNVRAPIQGLQRRLRAACDRAGVSRFTPHGLRRMVVGRLIRAGVDPGTAATLTGHSIQVMLRFYQQVTDEDRRLAVDQALLGELGTYGR